MISVIIPTLNEAPALPALLAALCNEQTPHETIGGFRPPDAVTDGDFDELKRYYTEIQIVDIVAVIALFGFLNRFNDTMATELESSPIEAGQRVLVQKGWAVGKHAG